MVHHRFLRATPYVGRMRYLIAFIFVLLPSITFANDVDRWLALRDERQVATFDSYTAFLKTHEAWPDKTTIQRRAEDSLALMPANSGDIIRYFEQFAPVSDRGRLIHVNALLREGRSGDASATLKDYWARGYFDSGMQDTIMANNFGLSADDHAKRIDTLLWQGNLARAENTLLLVSGNAQRNAKLRLNLQRFKTGADGAARDLMDSGSATPGLYFDAARFARQKDNDDRAVSILNSYRGKTDPYGAQWWRERSLLARRALERGNFQRAYNLAAQHGQTGNVELADAEWLAGWMAVTRLNQPGKAYDHFVRMSNVVATPISVSRAAYWAGYAASLKGDPQSAQQWYGRAAKHMNTFYGQMAAYALNAAPRYYADFLMRGQSAPSSSGLRQDLVAAARDLNARGMTTERDLFLTALLNNAKGKKNAAAVIKFARDLNAPKFSLLAAKAAYENGVLITDALFPTLNAPRNPNVEKALTLAIIRQESQFDPRAVSPANARGLMQLMPATAAQTARQCGASYSGAGQLFQPTVNMVLGQAYLERMMARYDDVVPLAASAYNAGPGNTDKWIAAMGDPRADKYSWADWVERIPFYETRNYVQRVWENYSLYREILQRR